VIFWKYTKYTIRLAVCLFSSSLLGLVSCVNSLGIGSNKIIANPSRFQTSKSLPKQQGHWPSCHWAMQFGDPQLVDLINEALANNPTIEVAKARVAQACALTESKAAVLLPNINWNGRLQRGRLPSTVLPPAVGGGKWFTLSEFLFNLNWELDFWGKNLSSLRQAIAQEKASQADALESMLSIATSVASTYNKLAYYYALKEILKRTVAQREALDKITSVRLRTGLDTKVQVYQSRNTVADARTQLADAEGQILLTRQQLGTLLGAGPDRGLTIRRPRLLVTRTPSLPPNLPLNLLGRRPDIIEARWQVVAACQGIKNAKAQFYPNVNLIGYAGFLSLSLSRFFTSASRMYLFGPAITLPIFDAGALRAQLRGRYGKYEEAVGNYNVTLNNAFSDVTSQITTIHSVDSQLAAQKEALSAAEHAYNLARTQYRLGLASQLVVLDAETSYLSEQQSRLQLITNRRNLQIALIKALGGGFATQTLLIEKRVHKCCRPVCKIIRDINE
jgi:NodT family efflux transporter outer membrane factor (OMF) lipoprotein